MSHCGEVQCSHLALAGGGRDQPTDPGGISPAHQKGMGMEKAWGALNSFLSSYSVSPSIFKCLMKVLRKRNIKEKECKYYGSGISAPDQVQLPAFQ